MKALNTIKFVTESALQFNVWLERIENAETYQKAVNEAHAAIGYIDCMTVYLNNMISEENNFFTGELGDTLDEWTANIYQKMVDKATETNQDHDTIWKLLCKRDEYKIRINAEAGGISDHVHNKRGNKMTIGTFTKMLGLATEFAEMWGSSETGLVDVSASCITKQPELHLSKEAFYDIADKFNASISFKNDDRTRPCFTFMRVMIFCLLTEKEAAEFGYLTEAEADTWKDRGYI